MSTELKIREKMVTSVTTVANYLYDNMTPGTLVEYKTKTLAPAMGLSLATADDRCLELQGMGILARHVRYGRMDASGVWRVGRYAEWELLVSREEALTRITEWARKLLTGEVVSQGAAKQRVRMAQLTKKETPVAKPTDIPTPDRVYDMSELVGTAEQTIAADTRPDAPVTNKSGTHHGNYKGDKVAVATKPTEETRAIAGPDAPSPMAALAPLRKLDDAAALIEAARQYAKRTDKVGEHVATLIATAKELGIDIDEKAMLLSIRLVPDERLETVSLVLPVIDGLEARIARLTTQVGEMREKVREHERLTNENRRLRVRLEQNVSERVIAAQRAQA